jgi:hypothetical protein
MQTKKIIETKKEFINNWKKVQKKGTMDAMWHMLGNMTNELLLEVESTMNQYKELIGDLDMRDNCLLTSIICEMKNRLERAN